MCVYEDIHTHTHIHIRNTLRKKRITDFPIKSTTVPRRMPRIILPVGYNPPDRILMPSWNHLALPNARKIETDLRKSNLRSCAWHYLDCRTINPPPRRLRLQCRFLLSHHINHQDCSTRFFTTTWLFGYNWLLLLFGLGSGCPTLTINKNCSPVWLAGHDAINTKVRNLQRTLFIRFIRYIRYIPKTPIDAVQSRQESGFMFESIDHLGV